MKKCVLCDTTCLTCIDTTPNSCLTCPTTRYFKADSSSCLTICPAQNYFPRTVPIKECVNCDPKCLTCTGTSNLSCQSCQPTQFFTADQTKCTDQCDSFKYYQVITPTKACLNCDQFCRTCNGGTPNSCTSCVSGRYLTSSNSCELDCDVGWWNNGLTRTCQ